MITSFEVGAVFRVINEASPTLLRILRQIRELNAAIEKARTNLGLLTGANLTPIGMAAAVRETGALATAWGDVAKNAAAAQRAIVSTAARSALPPAAAGVIGAGGAGGGRRHPPRFLARGGGHIEGPSMPIPGGSHARLGGGAMAAAGLMGYGVYEAAEMDDAVFRLSYASGLGQGDATHAKFRKIIQDAMVESGYNLHDVSEAALKEIQMFQGIPGGGTGIDQLPEMLAAAAREARSKGATLPESMQAGIGLAHMTKTYDPVKISKLMATFAALSVADPRSLGQIERAAGYAIPTLQSGLEIDPRDSLLLGTALARGGVTNTKSGTWLREMLTRAMPGTSLMSKIAFRKHEAALKAFGLVDDNDRPTWFTDGKPDPLKMLDIAGARAAAIPLEKRAGYERQLFGAQGSGAFGLLADSAVHEQVINLRKLRDSPEFANRYNSLLPDYVGGSTVQNARTAIAQFNVTLQDLGRTTLPAVNIMLGNLKSILEGIRNVLPGVDKFKSTATIGARVGEGAIAGAAWGAIGGPGGALGGALIGGVAGGVEGVAEQYMGVIQRPVDRFGREVVITGNSAAQAAEGMKALGDAIKGLPRYGGVFPGGTQSAPPISLSLNLDGNTLARAMSGAFQNYYTFGTGAAAADGVGMPLNPEHNTTDN